MRRAYSICILVLGLALSWSMVCGAEKVVVIPLLGDEPAIAPVEKTGQTECYKSASPWGTCTCGDADCPSGQDGDYQKGVPWPSPRFRDNGDGTVTDNLTGLIWLKNANCPGYKNWSNALIFANSLYDGWTGAPGGGDCGLSDRSSAGDWRLANVKELQSLIDWGNYNPALPSGHPFTGVESTLYWSSTTYAASPGLAFFVDLYNGDMDTDNKAGGNYVWPVRGGQ